MKGFFQRLNCFSVHRGCPGDGWGWDRWLQPGICIPPDLGAVLANGMQQMECVQVQGGHLHPLCSLKPAMEPRSFTPGRAGLELSAVSRGSVSALLGAGGMDIWGQIGAEPEVRSLDPAPGGPRPGVCSWGTLPEGYRVTQCGVQKGFRGSEGAAACRCMHEVGLGWWVRESGKCCRHRIWDVLWGRRCCSGGFGELH